MKQPQTSLVYFRPRDLAKWYEIVEMRTVGDVCIARRRALIGALDNSQARRARPAAAAETRVAQLYLDAPDLDTELEVDLALLLD